MKRKNSLGLAAVILVALSCFLVPKADAATVTRYMEFNGAVELWNWTQTGKTAIGLNVTPTTNPVEMADPAKVRIYDAGGTLALEYRNYRPEPNGFTSLNNWKTGVSASSGLVSFNLSGTASGTGVLPNWGEALTVTGVGQPSAYPDYDNVGSSKPWFAQTNGGAPTWWCESQANALVKDALDAGRFMDYVGLTFDSSALNPDGTVTLWIGGFVTEDLAGLEGGTAPYAVLEGAMKKLAKADDDGDGYFSDVDCDDSPAGDPAACATCTCDTASCAGCARCIHAGAKEFTGDSYDTNCNNQLDCFVATASFSTEMEGKVDALRQFRDSHLLSHSWGRVLVDLYYENSPAVASLIDSHAGAKVAVRTALLPVVGAAWAMNTHKGALAGLALGMGIVGLVWRRRENMKTMLVLLVAAGMLAVPMAAGADMQSEMSGVIQKSGNCIEAVTALLDAGYPEAEVIAAVLSGCEDSVTDVIATAIRSGADPFTVAYAAKGAGVDLQEVVTALEGASGKAVADEDAAGFEPPVPPISISAAPVVVISGTGSAWGQSHYVASPSL